jgi:hypothetical protein
MIWEEELKRNRRMAEWYAFLCGVGVTLTIVFFVAFFVVRLTGGLEACQ